MARVLLVATYELGHQPRNLAGPAALLREHGHDVRALDVSIDPWDPALVDWADKVAFSVPMHTATRLVHELAAGLTKPVCCYGLYADMCRDVADFVIAGEYEPALLDWVDASGAAEPAYAPIPVQLGRGAATPGAPRPARELLPALDRYTRLVEGSSTRIVGMVEASRGCVHRCRHCPVPVVYDGRVRIAAADDVIADIAQLVAAGATHITFGDPDFLNAPLHARRVVNALHERFTEVTWDCTTKVEHVLRHADRWPEFAPRGCLFVVSAFESLNDRILERLDKGHTASDAAYAVELLRAEGIDVRPSFLPFTPWTTRSDIIELLDFAYALDLVASIDPVQYTIRLLLPRGSLLLDHPDLAPHLGGWDDARLTYDWRASEPGIDALQRSLAALVEASAAAGDDPLTTYAKIRTACGAPPVDISALTRDRPRLTESWFCCAEPTEAQLAGLSP
jgi:radical SAM superfamily enzyme YgiQ (UPF0313 family)